MFENSQNSFLCGSPFVPFWSVKQFWAKATDSDSRHILECINPEVTKNPYYVLSPEGSLKKVSHYELYCLDLNQHFPYSGVGYRFLGDMLDKSNKLTERYLWCINFTKILKNHFLEISGPKNTNCFWIRKKEVCRINISHISCILMISRSSHPEVLCNFIEIALRDGCFPVNLLNIFRTPFLKNNSGWLLLYFIEDLVLISKSQ